MSGTERIGITNPGPTEMPIFFGNQRRKARHADQSLLTSIGCNNPGCEAPHFAAIALSARAEGSWRTVYISLTADQARDYAANLLRVADEIDGGVTKQ